MATSRSDLVRTFGRIGLISFGGPAAQISLMHSELVEKNGWLTEKQFLQALSFCMLLPGPEAMQLATYAGWRLQGVFGGLIAGLLFVLPGALVILALASGYALYGQIPLVQTLFTGIKAAVVVIVLQALLKLSRKALAGWHSWAMALVAFAAIFFLSVPFPLIIATAAAWGYLTTRTTQDEPDDHPLPENPAAVRLRTTFKTVSAWLALWLIPVLALWIGNAALLTDIAVFFSKLAVVTFGGAYAVLAYMTQAVVETHGWLSTPQMIDALGLAETTPGPLILVTEFVGFLAGYTEGGAWTGLAAAGVTLWVTFTPCFLWIFAGAPYIETLLARPRLKGAFDAISACVVGVILNLSVWFAIHVLFESVDSGRFGPAVDIESFSYVNACLVLFAAALMIVMRLPMIGALAAMALAGGATGFFI